MKLFKPLDYLAFLLSVGIIVLLAFQVYGKAAGPSVLYVQSDEKEWLYSLDEETEIAVPGILGDTVIRISGGTADVLESPCRDKICVNARPLEEGGEWTACLPNHVFLQIRGEREEELDDFSY